MVLGAEPRWRLMNLPKAGAAAGHTGLMIRNAHDGTRLDPALWDGGMSGTVERTSRGTVLETYNLFRVTLMPDLGGKAVVLPRP